MVTKVGLLMMGGEWGNATGSYVHAAKKKKKKIAMQQLLASEQLRSAPPLRCRGSAMQCGGGVLSADVYPVAAGVQPRSKQPRDNRPIQEQGCEFGIQFKGPQTPLAILHNLGNN